jgi:hypothetical protein
LKTTIAVKRIVEPMMGFKSFRRSRVIPPESEVTQMIRKRRKQSDDGTRAAAEQFYSPVTSSPLHIGIHAPCTPYRDPTGASGTTSAAAKKCSYIRNHVCYYGTTRVSL